MKNKKKYKEKKSDKYNLFNKTNSLLDLITPDAFEEGKDYVYLGPKKYARIYTIVGYPRNMELGYLNDLFSLGDIDISTYIENIPDGEIISRLTSKYSQLQSNLNLALKRGNALDYGMKLAAADIDALRESIQTNRERMFYAQPLLIVWARDIQSLDTKCDLLEDICSRKSLKIRCLVYEQNKGFSSALPLLNISTDNKYLRNMTTGAIACLIPIGNTELSHKEGILFGENLYTKSLIFYNNFIGSPYLTNPHTFVFGTTGAGKSVFLKLKGSREAAAKRWIVALDPQEEYKKMVNKLGGQYIVLKPGVKSGINPFELEVEEDEHENKKIDLYGKRTQIINMISIFAEKFRGKALKGQEITAVDEVICSLYSKREITEDANSLYITTQKSLNDKFYTGKVKKDLPTLSELREGLIQYNEKFKLTGIEELTEIMKMITGNGPMAMFDCQSSVSFDKRIIGICFKHLNDDFTKFFATVNTLSWIWGKFSNWKLKDIEKDVIVDEGSLFARYEQSLDFIELIARLGRKFKISLTLATQFIQDFLGTPTGNAIISLCATKVILKQESNSAKQVAEFFNLSTRCRDLISSFVSGQGILLSEQDLVVMQVTPFDFEWGFVET